MVTWRNGWVGVVVVVGVLVGGCVSRGERKPAVAPEAAMRIAPDIEARRAQFVRKQLSASTAALTTPDRRALGHLVRAAKVMDEIFAVQAWQGNPAFASRVAAITGPGAAAAKDYYRIMMGPWDRLRAAEAFLSNLPHPEGAGFYPEDLTREELDAWLRDHPSDRAALTSPTTVVVRQDGGLVAVPYSRAYAGLLPRAAAELRAAAEATTNASLKKFLTLRADAFASDDYFASDMAWMDLDSPIEVVIGPYETYEDGLFGYKAAFEAFICVEQPEESARLSKYKSELPYLESRLPIPDELKNTTRGSESPIRVADSVITGGDARRGVQTLAFNLPNDERVREAKGSKKVMLRNMMRAKFEAILMPIAGVALPAEELAKVEFEPYFHFILFHELCHGLGPGRITVGGRQTEVRLELKELYSAIEEAKADILGAYTLALLADKHLVPAQVMENLPATYVAGLFRSARFGTTEAHGLGVVLQTTYLMERGAIEVTPDGRFRPHAEKFGPAVKALAHDLLMVEAEGSYSGAQQLIARYGKVPDAMAAVLGKLVSVPVDVDPAYEADGWQ